MPARMKFANPVKGAYVESAQTLVKKDSGI